MAEAARRGFVLAALALMHLQTRSVPHGSGPSGRLSQDELMPALPSGPRETERTLESSA